MERNNKKEIYNDLSTLELLERMCGSKSKHTVTHEWILNNIAPTEQMRLST